MNKRIIFNGICLLLETLFLTGFVGVDSIGILLLILFGQEPLYYILLIVGGIIIALIMFAIIIKEIDTIKKLYKKEKNYNFKFQKNNFILMFFLKIIAFTI